MEQMQSQMATLQEERATLQAVLSDKKRLKRGVKEREARLSQLLRENERIESNTDKQCDAAEAQLSQYKAKVGKLKDALSVMEQENANLVAQNSVLAKENESHRYLIDELEGETEMEREQ